MQPIVYFLKKYTLFGIKTIIDFILVCSILISGFAFFRICKIYYCHNRGNMKDIFSFVDELDPLKVMRIYEPKIGLKEILVVDNVAARPIHR